MKLLFFITHLNVVLHPFVNLIFLFGEVIHFGL
jgi:hypothetical protein